MVKSFHPFRVGPRRSGLDLQRFPRLLVATTVVALASTTPSIAQALWPPPAGTIDEYGGVVPAVAPATGFFQVKQVGDRWMFVTPAGNGMWMTGVFAVVYSGSVDDLGSTGESRTRAKYGGGDDWQDRWRQAAARRLKLWGFNTLAEYHHWAMRTGAVPDPNPQQMPYLHIIKPGSYVLDNRYGFGPGPVKDLVSGTDPEYYTGYRGAYALDFFDPNFEAFVDGYMRGDDGLKYGNIGNPWMLGIAMDDPDTLFGFGPGTEIPAPRLHPHLGWIALVTHFRQANSRWVSAYADDRVHTKYALRDFLAAKYGTVSALNAAWASTYTSFDSDGGWGTGTGLLDENGRHAWTGSWADEMATASPGVRADLGEFLYLYARHYFSVMAAKMRQYAPQHLVFGPGALNGWGALTRQEILRAAGESLDVLQVAIGSPQALALTVQYAGNRPIVTWDSFVANPDSALWRYGNPEDIATGTRLASQQGERGQLYADKVDFLFNAVTEAGVHPVAGIKLWAWGDHWGEKANFGLVTSSDNAYDGREAIAAPGSDAWGWPTGGEERDYGDFLSGVVAAHRRVVQSLGGVSPASTSLLNVDAPAEASAVPRTVTVAGWAFDTSALSGPGVDMVRVFQGPACSGTVLADATLGVPRPDVQAAFGLPPSFRNAGFTAQVTLPAFGVQQITVCARSAVTGSFGTGLTRSVAAWPPLLHVDRPVDGAVRRRTDVLVAGWAFDVSAPVPPGMDLVRIFAGTSCEGTVLADARLGIARPDVSAEFSLPAGFGNTGYEARIMAPEAGLLTFTVCARTVTSGTFAQSVTRTVRPGRVRATRR